MDRDSMDRINVRTSDAIDVWLFRVEKECVRHGIKSKGKKLRKEQIINGIIAKVMSAGMDQTIAAIVEVTEYLQTKPDGSEVVRARAKITAKGLAKLASAFEAVSSN